MIQLQRLLLVCLVLLTYSSFSDSAVLIADFAMNRMIELIAKRPFCKLHTDRGDIQRMLLSADPKKIRQVPRENVLALEAVCMETGGLSEELQGGLGFIYPGTKWCGPGTLAAGYDDLGRYANEDKCCREHDLCPMTLSPGECKRGLCNSQSFTRSHCDCDARFRRCLQGLNTETANTLGAVFFNVVQVTCFKERRPCSVHQRDYCPWEYMPSGLYNFPNMLSLLTHNSLLFHHFGDPDMNEMNAQSRSLNAASISPDSDLFLSNEDRLRLESVGLIGKNLFKEMIIRQLAGFYQFYQKAREVIDGKRY